LHKFAMVLRDVMLKVKRTSKRQFGNPTILAKSSPSTADLAREIAHAGCCSACRAFDCPNASKSPTSVYASSSASSKSVSSPSLALPLNSAIRSASCLGKSRARMLSASGRVSPCREIGHAPQNFRLSCGSRIGLNHAYFSLRRVYVYQCSRV
jgi:hypothetical protein